MRRKPRRGADPFERQMELALNPGVFIPDRACFSFVSELEEVAAMLAKLARARHALPHSTKLSSPAATRRPKNSTIRADPLDSS
ncbi:MAG: hypothetical protein NTW28_13755 [Candidatus Solibacter sp.]|nr:hypothetical protein [Candidatus Solibacter sp.]